MHKDLAKICNSPKIGLISYYTECFLSFIIPSLFLLQIQPRQFSWDSQIYLWALLVILTPHQWSIALKWEERHNKNPANHVTSDMKHSNWSESVWTVHFNESIQRFICTVTPKNHAWLKYIPLTTASNEGKWIRALFPFPKASERANFTGLQTKSLLKFNVKFKGFWNNVIQWKFPVKPWETTYHYRT